MHQTGLEFAPGTTEECQRLVAQLFQPGEILAAYKQARTTFRTGDLVLSVSEQDPSGFEAEPRIAYTKRLQKIPLLMRGLADRSAHSVVKLPFEADAMWLIVVRGPQEVPVMCVIYAAPYETSASAN